MNALALMITLCGGIILMLTLPLAMRRVPMNRFYGVRLGAARSRESWEQLNACGGRWMAMAAVPIILTGLAGFFLPETAYRSYAWTAAGVVVVSVLVPTGMLLARARRLP